MTAGNTTIVAVSTGNLPSGIAIVRLSGKACESVLSYLQVKKLVSRKLTLCDILDPKDSGIIDQCMIFYAKGPFSFTGEDIVEFHMHGSKAIVQKLLRVVCEVKNVRLAEPGEFTRRAFLNGRLDLSEVEGLSDLLQAETESQRQLAIARYCGGLSDIVDNWRDQLISILSLIEAYIDFSDEEDVGAADFKNLISKLESLTDDFESKLAGFTYGQVVRNGYRVGIAGLPNVGKSSIVNALTRSTRAIVTDEAGTTRDIQEVQLDLGGRLFLLLDSAGIRRSESKAEQEGVRRSVNMMDGCDLVLWISAPDISESKNIPLLSSPVIHIQNKSDLGIGVGSGICISARDGDIDNLQELLCKKFDNLRHTGGDTFISRQRDKDALNDGLSSIHRAIAQLSALAPEQNLEFAAEDIRQTLFVLERLLGRVNAEDILDRVFSGFCIGK